MTLEAERTPTRKTLLAGGLGGLLGIFGGVLARPEAADAANDPDAVKKGRNNPTGASTTITCSGATAIRAFSNSGGADRSGIFASASGTNARGVTGVGPFGVLGQSNGPNGRGVRGIATASSGTPAGVLGTSRAPGGIAVFGKHEGTSGGDSQGVRGESARGIGVHGRSTSTNLSDRSYGVWGVSNNPNGSGVHGDHNASGGTGAGVSGLAAAPNADGVVGRNISTTGPGAGVKGTTESSGGTGVEGRAEGISGGVGVYGFADQNQGVGGWFEASGQARALVVRGPADLETSGIATVAGSGTSVTVNNANAKSTSIVLCTFLEDPAGRTVHVNRSNGSFQIVVSPAAAAGNPIDLAWLLLEN